MIRHARPARSLPRPGRGAASPTAGQLPDPSLATIHHLPAPGSGPLITARCGSSAIIVGTCAASGPP